MYDIRNQIMKLQIPLFPIIKSRDGHYKPCQCDQNRINVLDMLKTK